MRKNATHGTTTRPRRRENSSRARAKQDGLGAQAIATRGQAERARAQREDWYRVLVETTSQGVWTIDSEHGTTFVNRVMAEMLGFEPHRPFARQRDGRTCGADRGCISAYSRRLRSRPVKCK